MVGPPPESWAIDPAAATTREVVDGLWRLRLPTPWRQISHANAYAIEGDGDGIVLVDAGCGGHPTGIEALERALAGCGRSLADVTDLVVTHFHSDHVGSASTLIGRTRCRVWACPSSEHFLGVWRDPVRYRDDRERLATRLGVPAEIVAEFADVREETDGIDGDLTPTRELREGAVVPSAIGGWEVIEAPGHAPSQVCLYRREPGLLIAGDVVGPVLAPFFDLGFSPDPVAEHLASLRRLLALDVKLILPGHGRPLEDAPALMHANLDGIEARVDRLAEAIAARPGTGWELFLRSQGDSHDESTRVWRLWELAAYLDHLVRTDRAVEATDALGVSQYAGPARRRAVSGA